MQKIQQSPLKWTCEEINLMCIYDTSSRNALLTELRGNLIYVDEPEVRALTETVIGKVETISDGDFADIGFYPTFMD
jgi:hypothetical protein